MEKSREEIIHLIHQAGIIGAGGAGFPTKVKLSSQVDTIIANGSECEPLLFSDKALLTSRCDLVIEGIKIAMKATGASEGILAIKGDYHEVVDSCKKALAGSDHKIKLHLLKNYYPAGDEVIMIKDVKNKVVPEGGLPLDVGVVVSNVLTLAQIAQAMGGKPVTERIITITGEVANPIVVNVPIGTTYKTLIEMAGGCTTDQPVIIDGGPMMGKIITDANLGIGKTSSGLIVFPKDHFVIRMKSKPLSIQLKQSKSACCQCFRCTDLCPRNLVGHQLYPHQTMRTIDYNLSAPADAITSAFLCSQCGVCELVACDIMQLSPRQIYAQYRKKLTAAKVTNPHKRKEINARENFENTKLFIPTLMKKIDIQKYYKHLKLTTPAKVQKVVIPIQSHIGTPAVPLVKLGEEVTMCTPIAMTADGKLGAVYHASIAGVITNIDNNWIEING